MRLIKNIFLNLYPKAFDISQKEIEIAEKIIDLEKDYTKLKEYEIKERVKKIQERIKKGEKKENFIIEGFALVREVSRRTINKKHYKVQLLGGIALVKGCIIEMATGEGKTLTGTLPLFLWALEGKGVHLATTNEYLAQRDYEFLKPLYNKLGIKIGLIKRDLDFWKKQKEYKADITFGPGYEFGFDYLRDQLNILEYNKKYKLGEKFLLKLKGEEEKKLSLLQRGHNYILIDEVDSVLIDEARSPLIISNTKKLAKDSKNYIIAKNIAENILINNKDYKIDFIEKNIEITSIGLKKIYNYMKIYNLQNLKRPFHIYIENALRAKYFYQRDIDYIVEDKKIIIVDETTGRAFAERSWREGIHQAIEAKENLPITEETYSLARITRQKYFSLYNTIGGMTGTAQGGEREFWKFYKLYVVKIPLRKPCQRKELSPKIFINLEKKWEGIEKKILEIHLTHQPILIGTRTIKDSEIIAQRLDKYKIKYKLLNAKQDKEEAEIISKAGEKDSITIATNMAGRGADIRLGEGVKELGGLFVIGTELHESSRIDRQLIGRCARQGDPGIFQFFLSIEDKVIKQAPHIYKKIKKISLKWSNNKGELPNFFIKYLKHAQKYIEDKNYLLREELFYYDKWIDKVIEDINRYK